MFLGDSLDDETLYKIEEIQSIIVEEKHDLHRHANYDRAFFQQLNSSKYVSCSDVLQVNSNVIWNKSITVKYTKLRT